MEIVDLLTVGGPLIDMFNRIGLHPILHGRVVSPALLLMLHAFLVDLSYVFGALVAESVRLDWV